MKIKHLALPMIALAVAGCSNKGTELRKGEKIRSLEVSEVTIDDAFWGPRFKLWTEVTSNDVFDKFEGKHIEDPARREANDAFRNFDQVAQGMKGTGHHAGPPWYDGLVYETIRGVSDLLIQQDNPELEARIDAYIERIGAAQAVDSSGYIATWTELIEPDHRWGFNGGFLRMQHDVYNAGMLIEAGVHYYKATGKTKLLEIATRCANDMAATQGPAPKKNVVPAHSGPEEAIIKLYWLYQSEPKLKKLVNVDVNEEDYLALGEYWIENRGNHCSYPHWLEWGNDKSERWIKDQKYTAAEFGDHSRPSWGDYAQDSIPVFEQKTIEGHAVRATLLATGIVTAALENNDPRYMESAHSLWDNMTGKRMFITGGVGAIHFDEKFGADYFLPTDAYLETCAAVGSGFFSQRMNEMTADAKYIDELERTLYNNVLAGISLDGTKYTYQNPLAAHKHERWDWHGCPCCPPMFLKIVSAVPGYIYAASPEALYVNLFIGSHANINHNGDMVTLKQQTEYPWNGDVTVTVSSEKGSTFPVRVRIPGWATGAENPFGLYVSAPASAPVLKVNGEEVALDIKNGYAEISRQWGKDDKIELSLPMEPRLVKADDRVEQLTNMVAVASGPLVYGFDHHDNPDITELKLNTAAPFSMKYDAGTFGGINHIEGKAAKADGSEVTIMAVPYYAIGNRPDTEDYKVWIEKL